MLLTGDGTQQVDDIVECQIKDLPVLLIDVKNRFILHDIILLFIKIRSFSFNNLQIKQASL
jgi:hypothetical protein